VDPRAQLGGVDRSLQVLVERALIAREDHFEKQDDGPAPGGQLDEQLGREPLAGWQRVVVADEDDVRRLARLDQLRAREQRGVGQELPVVITDVLAPDVGVGPKRDAFRRSTARRWPDTTEKRSDLRAGSGRRDLRRSSSVRPSGLLEVTDAFAQARSELPELAPTEDHYDGDDGDQQKLRRT
jgi:hypothetical protein